MYTHVFHSVPHKALAIVIILVIFQAEVSQLEGSLEKTDTTHFPPYLIPDTKCLCESLNFVKQLVLTSKGIIIIPLSGKIILLSGKVIIPLSVRSQGHHSAVCKITRSSLNSVRSQGRHSTVGTIIRSSFHCLVRSQGRHSTVGKVIRSSFHCLVRSFGHHSTVW